MNAHEYLDSSLKLVLEVDEDRPLAVRLAEGSEGLLLDTLHSKSPSHSLGVGVLCSGSIVQHSHLICHGSGRVSGPSNSGSRSTSGDTGEGELRAGSIEVSFHSEYNAIRYRNVT